MAIEEPTLTELVKSNRLRELEDRWLAAIEEPDTPRKDLLEALALLTQKGKGDQAADLAWTWLTSEGERSEPEEVLALGREFLARSADSDDLRQEVFRLYSEVYADRPEIETLLEASGLSGGKSVGRALRTLEIGLGLQVGDFLISRSEEKAAEVMAIDTSKCEYTLKTKLGEQVFDPDALALAYDPVAANDFRVLIQVHPKKIGELLKTEPVELLIGILNSHHDRLDSDELEHMLVPRHIPTDKWRTWWTKTRTALKRCPHVVVEGRNPVILTYHAEGQTLEAEIKPQWAQAETSADRLTVVNTYLREAKNRQVDLKPKMVKRIYRDLIKRVKTSRKGSPGEALTEALIISRLAEGAELAENDAAVCREIIAESKDPVALLRGITENPLFLQALKLLKELKPEDWQGLYGNLLPFAPIDGCELIAKTLIGADCNEQLNEAVNKIPADFLNHLDAVYWLWRGPSMEVLQPMTPREMLIRLLDHLGDLTRSDATPPEIIRDARLKIRSALSAHKYACYKRVIEEMEAGLASTIRRTIERLEGLGQVVYSDLLKIINETHPELTVKPTVDPWENEGIIFSTEQGMARRKEQLDHLVNVKMPANAKAIGEAAARGDLSENSEYKFALEERDLLRARVAMIQNELNLARIITVHDVDTDQVNIGTHLCLQSTDGANRREMTILGPWEADMEKNIYNYRAPMCMKFRGLKVGDRVTLNLDDTEREYQIESIANALIDKPAD